MIFCPEKYVRNFPDVNEKLLRMHGEIPDMTARTTLVEFLRANLGFAAELLFGIKLAPFQEILLKAYFNRNFCLNIASRGSSKSWLVALYCCLKTIFEPNTKILILAPTFRGARQVFFEAEKMVNYKDAILAKQCFTREARRATDIIDWDINGGSIRTIPLNGDKIRGFRANVLILDEFLLFSEDIVKRVLMPFLVAPSDVKERMAIRMLEDQLIKEGKLQENEREMFQNTSQMICLSSASYTFEYLYQVYNEWIKKICMSPKEEEIERLKDPSEDKNAGPRTYFVAQLSYFAIPDYLKDASVIDEAKGSNAQDANFQREFGAQFVDGSDSFFSPKRMKECTIETGSAPTVEIIGDHKGSYIMAIDPNMGDKETADYFAVIIMKMNHESRQPIVVHNYAGLGSTENHHAYIYYLLTRFNIEIITIDNAGGDFFDSANQSALFKANRMEIGYFDFDSNKENLEYLDECRKARNLYNKEMKKICFRQFFSSAWIRRANDHLKGCIDYKKVWFGSKINGNDEHFSHCVKILEKDPAILELTKNESPIEFIDNQDKLIDDVKKQCALIDVRPVGGNLVFDLPTNLKRGNKNRARKDNYSALLLGNWANKVYYDLMDYREEQVQNTFTPFVIR